MKQPKQYFIKRDWLWQVGINSIDEYKNADDINGKLFKAYFECNRKQLAEEISDFEKKTYEGNWGIG